jgi:hypothetical protein
MRALIGSIFYAAFGGEETFWSEAHIFIAFCEAKSYENMRFAPYVFFGWRSRPYGILPINARM